MSTRHLSPEFMGREFLGSDVCMFIPFFEKRRIRVILLLYILKEKERKKEDCCALIDIYLVFVLDDNYLFGGC